MDILLYVMIALIVSLVAAGIFLARLIYKNLKQRNLNIRIAEKLQKVILSLQEKEKEQKNSGMFDAADFSDFAGDQISSPAMLSTILTVLVYKFKTLRISMNDFEAVPDDEYVSVYVDTVKKDMILSSNHDLTTEDASPVINFSNPNDDTFH